jgi:hypothetical protein
VSPISLDIVFKRIDFTIQKGLAAQLIAHPKLFNFGCTIQNTFRNNASHNGAESGSKFAVVDNNTVCHYFKLQPLSSDRTAVVNLPQLNLNHWFRSNGPQLRHQLHQQIYFRGVQIRIAKFSVFCLVPCPCHVSFYNYIRVRSDPYIRFGTCTHPHLFLWPFDFSFIPEKPLQVIDVVFTANWLWFFYTSISVCGKLGGVSYWLPGYAFFPFQMLEEVIF